MAEDFLKYIQILRKRIWIIILLPIISVLVVGIISVFVLNPVYESYVNIIVINKKVDTDSPGIVTYDDLLISQQLVKDYKEIVKSRSVTTAVIEGLMIDDLTPKILAKNIDVQSKNDTDIINIKVKDRDPYRAKLIVAMLTDVFQQKIFDLYENKNVKIIDNAEVQIEPVSPRIILNIALSLLVGLVIAILLVFLIELLDDTIRTSEEAEEILGIPVVGMIPYLKKTKRGIFNDR